TLEGQVELGRLVDGTVPIVVDPVETGVDDGLSRERMTGRVEVAVVIDPVEPLVDVPVAVIILTVDEIEELVEIRIGRRELQGAAGIAGAESDVTVRVEQVRVP